MDINCPVVIPYYGGKFTMSRQLVAMVPPHRRYFEPFFGGGSMFFRKKKAEWNVLNESVLMNVTNFSLGKNMNLRLAISEALENNLNKYSCVFRKLVKIRILSFFK